MRYLFIIFSLFIFSGNALYANDFTAKSSRTKVGTGETFTVSYTINTVASDFRSPQFNNFTIAGGPNQSTSTQWINGVVSQSHTFSYVLVAVKEGTFTIPPATIKVGNATIKSNEVRIEVIKGNVQQQQARQQHQHHQHQHQPQQQQTTNEDLSKSIFLKVSLNKSKAYLGEQIQMSYKLYQRVNLVNLGFNKLPSLNGFWSELIDDKNNGNINFHSEVLDGVTYNVAEIRKYVLFPQRIGTLEIDPLTLDCIIRSRSNKRTQSLFDQFFGSFEDVKYVVQSKPAKIEVLPFSDKNKPAGFKGAVGQFSLEARLDKNKVKAHEAINLYLSISGKGNLPLLETPGPVFPEDVEAYDPKITDKITVSATGVSGTKSFEYLMIPRHAGLFTIDPIVFSYFDPETKSYQTLTTGAFDIEVEKGDKEEGTVVSGIRKEDIKMLGSDIRYIKTNVPQFILHGDFFFGSSRFYLLLTLPFMLFTGFLVGWKRHVKQNSNVVWVKSKRATKIAVKRLKLAKKHLEAHDQKHFYQEIFKALYGYLSDKLNMPVAELNKENITERLKMKTISEHTIAKLTNTLDLCEMARFAPLTSISEQSVYSSTVDVITKIEEEIK